MSGSISLNQLLPAIKDVVDKGKEVSFTPEGTSMKPMLYGGRDEIVLIRPEFPLKKYDLPLYVRKNGSIVLHRVVKVLNKNGNTLYTMRGDNTYSDEPGITNGQIVAVVSRFKRRGKWYEASNNRYCAYVKLWCFIYPLRKTLRAIIRLPFRVVRKLKLLIKKP